MLYRKPLDKKQNIRPRKVAYFEIAFDVIHQAHIAFSHSVDSRKLKYLIDQTWWGIPEIAIRCYLDLCPEFMHVKPKRGINTGPKRIYKERSDDSNKKKYEEFGQIAQLYIIECKLRPGNDSKWILRLVDHASGFSHVRPLESSKSENIGIELIQILCNSRIPNTIHSNSGNEFEGSCATYLQKYFPNVRFCQGRACSLEKSNRIFKEALTNWVLEHPEKSWAEHGIYAVNHQMNLCPSGRPKNFKSPYELYFGLI